MSTHDDQLREAVSDLANAVQAAGPLATRLRRDLGEQAQDAVTLEVALGRAVRAVTRVRSTIDD